jgi:hypothetical protein
MSASKMILYNLDHALSWPLLRMEFSFKPGQKVVLS